MLSHDIRDQKIRALQLDAKSGEVEVLDYILEDLAEEGLSQQEIENQLSTISNKTELVEDYLQRTITLFSIKLMKGEIKCPGAEEMEDLSAEINALFTRLADYLFINELTSIADYQLTKIFAQEHQGFLFTVLNSMPFVQHINNQYFIIPCILQYFTAKALLAQGER